MNKKKLNIASWVLVALLLLPLFQQMTGLLYERNLKGSFKTAEYPRFELKNWFEGTYQDSLENAVSDNFGFHNFFIRANNQVAFTFFRKALANGVVIGKDNYLYESNYIKAYNGSDFLGDSLIAANANRLKGFQNYLEEKGKYFLVVFAAGKGSFYPEYIPDRLLEPPGRNNIATYKENFDSLEVNYQDYNQWFVEMKDSSRFTLYPKTGIHWSYYGMTLVFDSIVKTLDNEGFPVPEFGYGNIKLSRKYRSSDKDIEKGMNLLFPINMEKMAYPEIHISDEGVDKIKGVVIADSFYWGLHNMGFSSRVFEEGEFWYYNKQIIGNHVDKTTMIDDIDPLERLEDVEVIILMATEATMSKFPFGVEAFLD